MNKHLRLLEYRVRTLFPYKGQRPEDLCRYCPLVEARVLNPLNSFPRKRDSHGTPF